MSGGYNFRIHIGDDEETLTEKELGEFASLVGLDRVAPGRYSWLFAMHVLLYGQFGGVDPSRIVAELEAMEGGPKSVGTKPATRFTKEPLKGLWHKHFFSSAFTGHNLRNQFAGGRLKTLVETILDPGKHPIVTAELINLLSHEVVTGILERREVRDKLTGEWIIFAKHAGKNYYLCLASHNTGDQAVYSLTKSACLHQFPFLQSTH